MKKPQHQLTKDDVKRIAAMWETHTVQQIAEIIGCSVTPVYQVAKLMREAGYKIQYKRQKGELNKLILDAIEEL